MAHGPMYVVETISGHDVYRFGRSIYHEWEQIALRLADGVIGTSNLLLKAIGPFKEMCAIPPLLDLPVTNSQFESHPMILMVGDVEFHKGPDVWAKSLNHVFSQMHEVKAQLIGPDTPHGPDGASMVEYVRSLISPNFRNRFIWRGPLSHAHTLEAIDQASLVVVPSRFDSFSYVAAETLLRNKPLIVSDQVGINDWVSGLVQFPNGDVESLAQRQVQFLQETKSSENGCHLLKQQLLDTCSPDRYLESLKTFIKSCQKSDRCQKIHNDIDAIETMELFLADIERMESENRDNLKSTSVNTCHLKYQTVSCD